jgi:predicted signal transduction protein with EAL and GGDEF domain
MIDLDDFKQVNDSLGHEAGDRMLIEIADRFNRVLRDDDHLFGDFSRAIDEDETDLTLSSGERVMGRLGGDEFLIVLGQMPERSIAHAVAERLLASLADPIEIGPERIYARVSIGISVYPDDGADAAVLMRNADIALYEAKRRGRDQSVIFEPELNADAKRRLKMVAALNEALQLEQFFLLYQPELHMATGRVKAAEGLLRWQHPDFGLVMPLEFIPLLERSGLIIDVGHWVLKTACQQLALWEKSGLSLQTISVNISPKQLLRENFVDMVKGTLVEAGISAERLVLEVTESIFIDNAEFAIHTLNQVRELGVHVAIDDFGTGYSSLSYLRKIPLDILKIDRSFVVETKTENGQAICDMLIELSSRLGLEVVAEGIEEQQQLSALGGVDWIQGFLIASPLDPEAFRDLALSKSGNGISIRARKSV